MKYQYLKEQGLRVSFRSRSAPEDLLLEEDTP